MLASKDLIGAPERRGDWKRELHRGREALGTMETTKDLYPAEGEELVLEPNQFADELFDGLVDATVVVADGDVPNALGECRPDNNHASAYVECNPPG